MLLTETTRNVIIIASIVIATLAVVAGVALRGRRSKHPVPTATALPRHARRRHAIGLAALIIGAPVALYVAYWASTFNLLVLEVRDGRSKYGDRVFERKVGRAPLAFALADGDPDEEPWLGKRCWIVNRSSKPLRRLTIEYTTNDKPFVIKREVVIPAGRRASDCALDYYGPDFAPPATLREHAHARFTTAHWLTW